MVNKPLRICGETNKLTVRITLKFWFSIPKHVPRILASFYYQQPSVCTLEYDAAL